MASTTSDTGDTSSKQQQAQRKENHNKSKKSVSLVDHCHPHRRKKRREAVVCVSVCVCVHARERERERERVRVSEWVEYPVQRPDILVLSCWFSAILLHWWITALCSSVAGTIQPFSTISLFLTWVSTWHFVHFRMEAAGERTVFRLSSITISDQHQTITDCHSHLWTPCLDLISLFAVFEKLQLFCFSLCIHVASLSCVFSVCIQPVDSVCASSAFCLAVLMEFSRPKTAGVPPSPRRLASVFNHRQFTSFAITCGSPISLGEWHHYSVHYDVCSSTLFLSVRLLSGTLSLGWHLL